MKTKQTKDAGLYMELHAADERNFSEVNQLLILAEQPVICSCEKARAAATAARTALTEAKRLMTTAPVTSLPDAEPEQALTEETDAKGKRK